MKRVSSSAVVWVIGEALVVGRMGMSIDEAGEGSRIWLFRPCFEDIVRRRSHRRRRLSGRIDALSDYINDRILLLFKGRIAVRNSLSECGKVRVAIPRQPAGDWMYL